MRAKKICIICGKTYDYCSGCSDHNDKPRWMFLFCSENCKNIWEAINAYKAGEKTAAEAKAELLKCDLSQKKDFAEVVKTKIDEIFKAAMPERNNFKYNNNKKFVKENNDNSESK